MLIEEDDSKPAGEINPDALELVFEEDSLVEEEIVILSKEEDEEADEIDIAFAANDEGQKVIEKFCLYFQKLFRPGPLPYFAHTFRVHHSEPQEIYLELSPFPKTNFLRFCY